MLSLFSLCHSWSCHQQSDQTGGEVWSWVGSEHHRAQSSGHGQWPQLPPQDDHSFLHQCEPVALFSPEFSWVNSLLIVQFYPKTLICALAVSSCRLCHRPVDRISPLSRCCQWSLRCPMTRWPTFASMWPSPSRRLARTSTASKLLLPMKQNNWFALMIEVLEESG